MTGCCLPTLTLVLSAVSTVTTHLKSTVYMARKMVWHRNCMSVAESVEILVGVTWSWTWHVLQCTCYLSFATSLVPKGKTTGVAANYDLGCSNCKSTNQDFMPSVA